MSSKNIPSCLLIAALLTALPPFPVQSESPHPGLIPGAVSPGDPPKAETAENTPRSLMGEVIFPHDEHSEEMEVECEECHHETNAAPLEFPHPSMFDDFWVDCQICHHPAGAARLEPQACSNCHSATTKDAADETLSAKVVIHERCWSCHEVGVGVEASDACEDCHTGP